MHNADRAHFKIDVRRAHEPRHALPPAGDVRRLREPAADAGRLAVQLPARAGGDGVPGSRPVGVGRDARARRRDRRLRRRRAPPRRRTGTSARMTDWTPREIEIDLSFLGGADSRTSCGRWSPTSTAPTPITPAESISAS